MSIFVKDQPLPVNNYSVIPQHTTIILKESETLFINQIKKVIRAFNSSVLLQYFQVIFKLFPLWVR